MPKFVIERSIPGAHQTPAAQLKEIARKSRAVLNELGPDVQWLHSYVAEDKLYCVYFAASKELILEHARRGGFPADRISRVAAVIDPATAE